jgi:hypothetical protein
MPVSKASVRNRTLVKWRQPIQLALETGCQAMNKKQLIDSMPRLSPAKLTLSGAGKK